MRRIGIDPGFKGCIAVEDDDGFIHLFDMPVNVIETPKGNIHEYRIMDIWLILSAWAFGSKASVEHQRYYGYGDNAKSLAPLMFGYGVICAILTILGIPFNVYEPAVWKREMLGSKSAKKAESVALAKEIHPKLVKQLLVSKDGRSDALLIMQYDKLKEDE